MKRYRKLALIGIYIFIAIGVTAVTPMAKIGEGTVTIGFEGKESKNDNPQSDTNRTSADVQKDNPNFPANALTASIAKNAATANAKMAASLRLMNPNKPDKSAGQKLKTEMQRRINEENRKAKEEQKKKDDKSR